MTIKKFVFTAALVTIALSTFASDMVPVSAPILAVELSGSEKLHTAVPVVAPRVIAVELPPIQVPAALPIEVAAASETETIVEEPLNEPAGETNAAQPETRELTAVEKLPAMPEHIATDFANGTLNSLNAEQLHTSDSSRLKIEQPAEALITENTPALIPVKIFARKTEAPSFLGTFAGYFDSLVAQVKTLVPTERTDISVERIPQPVVAKNEAPIVEAAKKTETTSIFVPFARFFASISEDLAVQTESELTAASNETALANEVSAITSESLTAQPDSIVNALETTGKAAEFESEVASAQSETNASLSNETNVSEQAANGAEVASAESESIASLSHETAVSENAANDIVSNQFASADALPDASATSDFANEVESDVTAASSEGNTSLDVSYAASLLTPEAEISSLNADNRSDALIVRPELVVQPKAEVPVVAFSATSASMFDTFVPSLAADQRSDLRIDQSIAAATVEQIRAAKTSTQLFAVAEKPVPVLISNQAELSLTQLPRFAIEPLPVAVSFADTISSLNRGPNAETTIVAEALPKTETDAKNATLPMLIGGKTMFSNDLLKPMNLMASKPAQVFQGYCDANFVGAPIRFTQTVELKLEDLLSQLHTRFGVNFIMGPNIGSLPLNVKAGSIPWNVLLRSQLFISGVRAKCIDANTIELVENTVLPRLQDGASVTSRFVKLKFLQRTSGGTVDLANRSQGGQNGGQGGCGGGGQSGGSSGSGGLGGGGGGQSGQTAGQQGSSRFDQLIVEIEKILGLRSMTQGGSGGGGGASTEEKRTNRSVTQIPGRNILVIKATEEEHALIDEIIARADRPPFQVVIKGLVYSANQDRLRDIGVQTTITGGTADNRVNGGIFGNTLGTGTLFDFSAIIGTFDFNVQMTALQRNGIISVKSRPFATVLDGLCTTLNVGRELPIVINSTLGGQGDVVFVNAANNLAVTPYVIDDENGNPIAVTLELRLDANDVDSSVTSLGVPAISRRSIQTQLLLAEDKTAILGGFTVDQDSKTVTKVPGLGDIPIIGELFKRRVRDTRISRLYFAISVEVIPYPEAIAPVVVPGATTDPPSITTQMKKRAEEAEPKPADPNKPYEPKKKKDNDN